MTEAMTLEEMEAAATGQFTQPEEVENEQPAEADNDEAEYEEESLDDSDDEATDEAEEDEEPAEEVEEEKPRMNRASQRVKDAVDRANKAEMQLQQLQYEMQKQREVNEKLMNMLTGGQQQEEMEDDEILDTALQKKFDERFGKLEQQQINAVKAQELATIGGENGEVYNKALAAVAVEIIQDRQSYGQPVSELQAEQMARDIVNQQMQQMISNGAQPGAIASQLNRKAQYFDMLMGNTGQPQKKGVNMKAVEKARKTAGAPTIDKESVNIGGGSNLVHAEVKKARESGLSAEYLSKWGL